MVKNVSLPSYPFLSLKLNFLSALLCLTTALEQKSDFQNVARMTAAFISLATPHTTSEEAKDWCQPQLLRESKSFHKNARPTSREDAKRLGSLCLRFEAIASGFHLLTLCETKETALKRLLGRNNKSLVRESLHKALYLTTTLTPINRLRLFRLVSVRYMCL
jgi:hypothetical protein